MDRSTVMEAVACVAMEGTGDNRGQSGARD